MSTRSMKIAALFVLLLSSCRLYAQTQNPGTGGGTIPSTTSILKGDGAGNATAATSNTDYAPPVNAIFTGPFTSPCFSSTGTSGSFPCTNTFSANGAASISPLLFSGNPYTGGTGTTTYPVLYMNNGATPVSQWSTAGTYWGVNAASGFSGNFIELFVNNTVEFKVDAGGGVSTNSLNNVANGNNSQLALTNNGAQIMRSIADANPAVISLNNNASSTGDIHDFKNSTGIVASVLNNGAVKTVATYQVTEGTAIASASTIAPTTSLFHITGTTTISTMTPPSGFTTTVGAGTGGCVDFITDAAVTFNAGTGVGQFKSSLAATAGAHYHPCYTPSTGLWYF